MEYTLSQIKDVFIGTPDSKERKDYETELELSKAGEMIKIVRKKRGLTQSQLAEELGVKKSHISKLESGKNITMKTLFQIMYSLKAKVEFKIELQ